MIGRSERISKLTDEETLAYLQQLQRERSKLEARMTRAMAHFHALRLDIAHGSTPPTRLPPPCPGPR